MIDFATGRRRETDEGTGVVTGGEGFIGSHLVERLVADGRRVRVLAVLQRLRARGWLDASPVHGDVEIMPGDVRDGDRVRAGGRRAATSCSTSPR